MNVPLQNRPRRQIRVVLSSTALLSFMSVRKAAALAIAQLGVAAFFVAGTARVGAWRLGRLVRAGRRDRWRVRPRHRHRELGAPAPGRRRGPRPPGLWSAGRESRGRGRSRRTAPPRGTRLHRHRPVRLDRDADGDRGLAADRLRLRPEDFATDRGRAAGRAAVAPRPHRPGLHVEPHRAAASGLRSAS